MLLAAVVALLAMRAKSLTAGGAVTATLVGTAAVAAGWPWAALLLLYFVSSTLLSRLGATRKAERTAGVVAKPGARDAWQVSANGAAFAVGLLVAMMTSGATHLTASVAAVCALSASAADTWATEIGTLVGHTPRSILTFQAMHVGESGGVTAPGWFGALAGSTIIAAATALLLPELSASPIVLVAGMIGTIVDSLVGATVQHRRWCDPCGRMTEMPVHSCGATTRHLRGVSWIDNDAVNLIATITGALVPVATRWILR